MMNGMTLSLGMAGDYFGRYRITGVITEMTVPGAYPVRLYRRSTGLLHKEIWSSANGSYTFNGLAYIANGYFAIAFDYGQFPLNAAIADLVTPEPMP